METSDEFVFSWNNLRAEYLKLLEAGYTFLKCSDYAEALSQGLPLPKLAVVSRVDVDLSPAKADRLREILDGLGIKASFFVRLHALEYNPFSFENYRIFRSIMHSGHELGLHTEIIDASTIWQEDARACFERDLAAFECIFGARPIGTAAHGGATGLNNLDFWKTHTPEEFGQLYEAYSESESFSLFQDSIYVSDSEWTRWKSYDGGRLQQGDRRSPSAIAENKPPLIYMLVHPDTYFDRHCYERDR